MGRLLTNRIIRIRDIGPMEQCYKEGILRLHVIYTTKLYTLLPFCLTVFYKKAIKKVKDPDM
jgi:hypothetical protein